MVAITAVAGLPAVASAEGRAVRNWLGVLVLFCVATVPFVEWPGSVVKSGFEGLIKAMVFYLFTVAFVRSERTLKIFMAVFLAAQTLRVLEPLSLHVTEGYWGSVASMANWEYLNRLAGAPSDIINPNGLAFVILTVISFSHFLLASSPTGRVYYVVSLPAHLYALLLTASRSGFVGLVGIFGLVWWHSKHKLAMVAVTTVTLVLASPHIGADLKDRYLSIVSRSRRRTLVLRRVGFKR